MRTIKFRAWDKHNKKWLNLFFVSDSGGVYVQEQTSSERFSLVEKSDVELCRFTGLLDKNSKEIFEGDIVRNKELNWEIGWWQKTVSWTMFIDKGKIKEFRSALYGKNLEIIGNVYENPSLLPPNP